MQAQRCADVAKPAAAGRPRLPDFYRMELALDVGAPELQEAAQLGKIRSEVELLPDKALQQIGVVRHPVDDLRRGQPILTKMGNGIGHSGLLSAGSRYPRACSVRFVAATKNELKQ